ncbi:hypothetical protein [Streptacidiphilus anmyonensis]|uniref:hypothetical protein n=1 Tax=Streptacidiphilus anmyonensis TaxID=405782 RepID=UPI0005A6BA09|nr:hypothetical protein [Streptacidiphilus anmyonensis]
MKKVARIASLATSLSIAAVIGSTGVAHANTDSYTYDHVEIGAANNGASPTVWICNQQSSANWLKFWVHSVGTGGNLDLSPGTMGWITLGNNQYETYLNPGECRWAYIGTQYTVQVYGGSGSLSWGTDPIPWTP